MHGHLNRPHGDKPSGATDPYGQSVRGQNPGPAPHHVQSVPTGAVHPGTLIWDLPIRLFHWLLVGSVATAAITGFLAPEWWLDVHYWAGSVIGFLIVFRLIWGFIGSQYARFTSFIFSVPETTAHIQAVRQRKPSHYAGHNPAGALMVFALLGVLGILTLSGLLILGGQEKIGPLAGIVSFTIGAGSVELHELFAFGLLALIFGHLAGVLMETVISKENLVRAMISGRKMLSKAPGSSPAPSLRAPASMRLATVRAGILASVLLLAGGTGSWALMRVLPRSLAQVPANTTYANECGDCHHAYNPSLLPASSWRAVMNNLDNHFGEDASLEPQLVQDLSAYLTGYSADKWDSEAAHNLRHVAPKDPDRITSTPYWKRRHAALPKAVWVQPNVNSKGNCSACHGDALAGTFADEAIKIPSPPPLKSKAGTKSAIKTKEIQ